MMRSIHLYGRLKKLFGPTHRFDVLTAAEGLRALNCAFPGDFVGALQTGSYKLVMGDFHSGMRLDLRLVNELRLGKSDLHLIPLAVGSANGTGKGTAKTVLGAALIGGAIFASGGTLAAPLSGMASAIPGIGLAWGNLAAVGLGVALTGVSTLLAKADTNSLRDTATEDSHMLSGPGTTGGQGSAIPLIYGRCMVTPTPISIDADIEDIGAYDGAVGVLA